MRFGTGIRLDLIFWYLKIKKVGVSILPLHEITKSPIKRTESSYVHVFDGKLPIYETDEQGKFLFKIGEIRTIVYLEDLGPLDKIQNRIVKLSNENTTQKESNKSNINLNQEKIDNFDPLRVFKLNQNQILQDLNQLEYKVVWELESWKKAEVE